MKAPWSGQLSAAKTGWLFALIFFGLLAFLFLPGPKKPEPPPTAPFVKPPPSRLVALGLPDNPDLEHLPEFFALFADQAEWKNNKTIFAFWNPGSNSYSYFFEAMRVKGTYHFKVIPGGDVAEVKSEDGFWWSDNLPADCPMRFILSEIPNGPSIPYYFEQRQALPNAPAIDVNLHVDRLSISPPTIEPKLELKGIEQKQ